MQNFPAHPLPSSASHPALIQQFVGAMALPQDAQLVKTEPGIVDVGQKVSAPMQYDLQQEAMRLSRCKQRSYSAVSRISCASKNSWSMSVNRRELWESTAPISLILTQTLQRNEISKVCRCPNWITLPVLLPPRNPTKNS